MQNMPADPTRLEIEELNVGQGSARNSRVVLSPSLPAIIADQQNGLESLGGRVDITGKHEPVSYRFDVGQLEKKRARIVHRTTQIQFLHLFERTRDRNSNGRLARQEGHQHDRG